MRIHIWGSTAVPTTVDLTTCAFVQRAHKYARGLKERGHYVIVYGTAEYASEYVCDEFIPISTRETFLPLISERACHELLRGMPLHYGYQFGIEKGALILSDQEKLKEAFKPMWHPDPDSLSPTELHSALVQAGSYGPYLSNLMGDVVIGVAKHITRVSCRNLLAHLTGPDSNVRPGDILLPFYNNWAVQIFREFEARGGIVVEGAVGYGTTHWTPLLNRGVFHSTHQLNYRHSFQKVVGQHHTVIPPSFTVSDFIYNPDRRDPRGPYLYLARLQECKGFTLFLQLAQHFKDKIFWAAGPVHQVENLIYVEGRAIDLDAYPNLEYKGIANKEMRARLLSQATALIQPSQYDEPFGCNVVEANFAGTPAIAPARGGFLDTIEDGLNGFKYGAGSLFFSFDVHWSWMEWETHLHACAELSPEKIRARAMARYSEAVVLKQYVDHLRAIRRNPGPLLISDPIQEQKVIQKEQKQIRRLRQKWGTAYPTRSHQLSLQKRAYMGSRR